jgi:hypothetical protein
MECDRQLDYAERAAEVTTCRGDGLDDRLADLGSQLLQLGLGQAPEIGRAVKCREDGHAGWLLGDVATVLANVTGELIVA